MNVTYRALADGQTLCVRAVDTATVEQMNQITKYESFRTMNSRHRTSNEMRNRQQRKRSIVKRVNTIEKKTFTNCDSTMFECRGARVEA